MKFLNLGSWARTWGLYGWIEVQQKRVAMLIFDS
jgi:hypothetical protein